MRVLFIMIFDDLNCIYLNIRCPLGSGSLGGYCDALYCACTTTDTVCDLGGHICK